MRELQKTQRIVILETELLRLTSGVTRFDDIRNMDIYDLYGAAPIVERRDGGFFDSIVT